MRTRSKTKRTRENLNRLPREVEATLPSWVKCTDPIPREILEEVRSTVTRWIKNVRNYVEETETYILNDEHVHQEIVDDGWAFFVDRYLCHDPRIQGGFPHNIASERFDLAEGVGKTGYGHVAVGPYRGKLIHTAWYRFIRRMILSDVNIIHQTLPATIYNLNIMRDDAPVEDYEVTDIVVGSRKENIDDKVPLLRLAVQFHDRLSSEIKDEICSKLASALRALKSRISRICGINELERRTQSH